MLPVGEMMMFAAAASYAAQNNLAIAMGYGDEMIFIEAPCVDLKATQELTKFESSEKKPYDIDDPWIIEYKTFNLGMVKEFGYEEIFVIINSNAYATYYKDPVEKQRRTRTLQTVKVTFFNGSYFHVNADLEQFCVDINLAIYRGSGANVTIS